MPPTFRIPGLLRHARGSSAGSIVGTAAVAAVAFAVVACSTTGPTPTIMAQTFACPTGTSPCGNGCMPSGSSVCCDNGSLGTSSYCVNSAGGGCSINAGACTSPDGTGPAQFCCAQNAALGSADCPGGQHHCGSQCWPLDHPCCAPGSSTAACPETSWDPIACTLPGPGDVACAVCLTASTCRSCPAGDCCHGDPCAGGDCVRGNACGASPVASGDGGGSCAGGLIVSTLECDPIGNSGTATYCLSATEYTSATGNPLPSACASSGTTGCLATTGPQAGVLVAPCCPGLTCRVGSACGDSSSAVGGTCLP